MIRLNVGCGAVLIDGYVNIDRHKTEEIIERYGYDAYVRDYLQQPGAKICDYNILSLPYEEHSVDEILCDGFLEHLSFNDERLFFQEVNRVLKKGGLLNFSVPDFDAAVKQWQEADDDFKDFYVNGTEEHWFGNYDRNIKNKWGYLTATIFGNQNGEGQFHRTAYTVKKILKIMKLLNFTCELEFYNFKNTEIKMIRCKSYKK